MCLIFSSSGFRRWRRLVCALWSFIICGSADANPTFETVYGFENSSANPEAAVIKGSDGNFYGTTKEGGAHLGQNGNGFGTVFRMKPDGSLTILVNFNFTNGRHPAAALVEGIDGNFYGTTSNGGSNDSGTVFKITPDGTLTTLVNFTSTNGRHPVSSLVQGGDGSFYGTTKEGGGGFNGTVFRVTPQGALTTLVNFSGPNGRSPQSALTIGSDGNFYGTTSSGGNSEHGTLFRMSPSGILTTLVHFTGSNGAVPISSLVEGNDGGFYGTTALGGNVGANVHDGNGTVFKMTPDGSLTTLVYFTGANGRYPAGGLVRGGDGDFYGTTARGGTFNDHLNFGLGHGTVFKMSPGGILTTLVDFNLANGANPRASLLDGGDGNFYGTTALGGVGLRHGTVFRMTPNGSLTSLVSFKSPMASHANTLLLGGDGNLYGTTRHGGIYSNSDGGSYGTAFKLTLSGTFTNMADFSETNGGYPEAALAQDGEGNFYGITNIGGSANLGTVFKMTSAGVISTLVNFNGANGRHPESRLVRGNDGNFYGTTTGGGSNSRGTVFKVTPEGLHTTMVDFTVADGSYPNELVRAGDGDFYGTTRDGGSGQSGTAFMMTPAGVFTTLVNFMPVNNQSSNPSAALIQGRDGNFYGMTDGGGGGIEGTAFRMTPQGILTTLVNRIAPYDTSPAALVEGDDGNFYGTTKDGGANWMGNIFMMTPSGVITTILDFNGNNGSYPDTALVRGTDGHFYGTTRQGGVRSNGLPSGGGQIYRLRMGPTVTTTAQTNVTSTKATLNGIVNPGGKQTSVIFHYGTDPTLAVFSTSSTRILPIGSNNVSVPTTITGLQSDSFYYFRVVASNSSNTVPQSGSILRFTTLGPQGAYSTWAASTFSSSQLSDPLVSGYGADPDSDNVVNLLEYAFNMPALSSASTILTPSTGTSGLPHVRRTESPAGLSIQYVRRKASVAPRLSYRPQFSSGLNGAWEDFSGTETIQSINSSWERVTVEKSVSLDDKQFGRVKVSYSE